MFCVGNVKNKMGMPCSAPIPMDVLHSRKNRNSILGAIVLSVLAGVHHVISVFYTSGNMRKYEDDMGHSSLQIPYTYQG